MMNTPSMYSVEQLLKARQNGVPDYVVVPMLQKAMAQKQAMAQQQALQQGMTPHPPVADQILDAAHNDVMQEHMARNQREKMTPVPSSRKEARGIDVLPSGINESDYAHGGIIAFAKGEEVPSPEEDVVELPAIVNRHKNIFGQSKNDVPKDYPDVPANVADARRLIDESYSQFDNPDDFVTKWRGKNASDLPTYKKNAHEFLKKTGWKEGDKLNLKDTKDVNRMMSVIAQQEMGAHVSPDKWDAVAAGKYKLGEGVPAAPAKEAPKGIASLVQRPEVGELDVSGYDKMMSKPEERDIDAQAALAQKRYGENPDLERRAKSYDEQETKLKGDDDKAMWKALMHAGIGMMSGKSPNFMSNLASGVTAGAEDYEKTREDIDAKKAHLAQLRDALGDARRQEKLAVIKHGEDSAQAAKASDKSVMLAKQLAQVQYAEHKISGQSANYAHDIDAARLPSEVEERESKARYYSTVNEGKEDIKTQQLLQADTKDFVARVEKELEKSGLLYLPPDNPKVINARAEIEASLAPYYPRLVEAGIIGKSAAAPDASVIKPMPQVLSKPTVKGADFDYQWTPKG